MAQVDRAVRQACWCVKRRQQARREVVRQLEQPLRSDRSRREQIEARVRRKRVRREQRTDDANIRLKDGNRDVAVEVLYLRHDLHRSDEFRAVPEDHQRVERVNQRDRQPTVERVVTTARQRR